MSDYRKLQAIDLYSGAGGWSAGLTLAGVEVVASYERWEVANRTNRLNNHHPTQTCNIRGLNPETLPKVDVVVGSPPCTEFSLSNRGGGGDIKDGLKDVAQFLRIVTALRPRFWVMENVPRAAAVIEQELKSGGELDEFRQLKMEAVIVKMDAFGVPQRRRRSLIGNIDFRLLESYTVVSEKKTLGDVITALQGSIVEDPLFGIRIPSKSLRDHDEETSLDTEESRINRAAKTAHPIYNAMMFPDPLDRPVRTITATCTRVSRESVVVASGKSNESYRRLSLRERACLQGFPITYQFFSETYGDKVRMIGNAVPPAFTYFVGHALLGHTAEQVPTLRSHAAQLSEPDEEPPITRPRPPARRFPPGRTFRFSIPNLRLKSGVRFELTNSTDNDCSHWSVGFIFGTSRAIIRLELGATRFPSLYKDLDQKELQNVTSQLVLLERDLSGCDISRMQAVWSHTGPGGTGPFQVLDLLGSHGAALITILEDVPLASQCAVSRVLDAQFAGESRSLPGVGKLLRNATLIHAGLIIGSAANRAMDKDFKRPGAPKFAALARRA